MGRASHLKKGEMNMATKITGSFAGKIRGQAVVSPFHLENHSLSLIAVAGTQKSADPLYNDAKITYWGTAEIVNGNGPQKGYWCNERANGERDWGTFEGKITTNGQQVSMEGTFAFTGGTGKFKGITGTGKYKGNFPSPTDVVNNWEGEYTLVAAKTA
jgi:hypothetical protein